MRKKGDRDTEIVNDSARYYRGERKKLIWMKESLPLFLDGKIEVNKGP